MTDSKGWFAAPWRQAPWTIVRERVTSTRAWKTTHHWKFAILLICASHSPAFSQHMLQGGFFEASVIFASTGYGYSRYANHILSMGDVNRDGYPDIFINAGISDPFHTWLLFGTKDGTLDRSNFIMLEGYGTLAKGDVNGDGLIDLLVQSNDYTVTMYPGCLTCPFTIDTVPAWRIHAESRYSGDFGNSIAIGDLNGDGREDLVISAPDWWTLDSGHVELGKLFIYYGGSSVFPQPDITAVYPVLYVSYSENGIRIGDVNGDGHKDLIVGSNVKEWPTTQFIDVFFGGPGFKVDTQHPNQRIWRENLSFAFLNILDMNNDGIADLYIGDGAGYIFHGGPEGLHASADRIILCPDSIDYWIGGPAHRIGDINKDGFDDYLLSGKFGNGVGMGFVYLGCSQGIESYPVAVALSPEGHGPLREEAINVGDMNADGVNDFAASYVSDNGWGKTGFAVFAGRSWWRRTPTDEVPAPQQATLTIYPNPVQDYAMIAVSGIGGETAEATIYNIYGKEIRRLPAVENFGSERIMLWDGKDAMGSATSAGVYYCILLQGSGTLKGMIVKR